MLFYLYNIENIAKRLESLFAESRVEELGEPYS